MLQSAYSIPWVDFFSPKEEGWRNLSWVYLTSARIGVPAFNNSKLKEEEQFLKKNNIALKIMN